MLPWVWVKVGRILGVDLDQARGKTFRITIYLRDIVRLYDNHKFDNQFTANSLCRERLVVKSVITNSTGWYICEKSINPIKFYNLTHPNKISYRSFLEAEAAVEVVVSDHM